MGICEEILLLFGKAVWESEMVKLQNDIYSMNAVNPCSCYHAVRDLFKTAPQVKAKMIKRIVLFNNVCALGGAKWSEETKF